MKFLIAELLLDSNLLPKALLHLISTTSQATKKLVLSDQV